MSNIQPVTSNIIVPATSEPQYYKNSDHRRLSDYLKTPVNDKSQSPEHHPSALGHRRTLPVASHFTIIPTKPNGYVSPFHANKAQSILGISLPDNA